MLDTAHKVLLDIRERAACRGRTQYSSPSTAVQGGEGCLMNHVSMIMQGQRENGRRRPNEEVYAVRGALKALHVAAGLPPAQAPQGLTEWNDSVDDAEFFRVLNAAIQATAPWPVDLPMASLQHEAPELVSA